MGQNVEEISKLFQDKIEVQYSNLEIKDQFTFLTDINEFTSKILKNLVEHSYVDIAKQLRKEELRIDDVYKYVGKILQVLKIKNRAPTDLNKTSEDLFKLINEIEKETIKKKLKTVDVDKMALDYIANLDDYVKK
ncbi:MAG: hypothetical protein HeimC2_22190 [Candidatus Heimdallarchaeota archaeon LC_2]|nr:MAG: hypothetical protein HeimC2_22190 [Candidatus Heimdallarchaeota archaeon LC_2]